MKNKKGLGILGVIVTVLLIAIVGVGSVMLFGGGFQGFQKQKAAGTEKEILTVTGDCNVVPYITLSGRDATNPGTSVTVASHYQVNGVYTGTLTSGSTGTNFAVGDKVDLMVGATNYINTTASIPSIKCGNNNLVVDVYATDDSTIQIKGTAGDVLTNSYLGGSVNQSNSATNINLDVKFTANSDQSSGDLIYVVEPVNTTQVNDIIMSGVDKVPVPTFYTVNATGSIAKAFLIPALKDGDSKTYTLTLTPESGITMGTTDMSVFTHAYSKEYFVDTDGSFVLGVENKDGVVKYEDDFTYNFYIQ